MKYKTNKSEKPGQKLRVYPKVHLALSTYPKHHNLVASDMSVTNIWDKDNSTIIFKPSQRIHKG